MQARSGPAVVFVHGAGSNADFWHEQRTAFPNAHYLNLPGHTQARDCSSVGEPMHSVDEYAAWVTQYIEQAGLDRVALNGHSMGGAIVQTVALEGPWWLRGLVLTGTGARLRVLPRLLELLRTDYEAAVDLIVELSFAQPLDALTYGQRVRRNGVRRQILRTPREVTLADYQACDHFDVMDRIAEIEVPTLCVVGPDDNMTPPKYSEYLHRQIRGSDFAIIEGAGHMLPMEKPEEYNAALISFLAGLDEKS
jgi:pimeloyl-ACP methyl ester carboxylesterase